MALPRSVALQQRSGVFVDSSIGSRALAVIPGVDRDTDKPAIGQRSQERKLLLFFRAGAVQNDNRGTPAGGRRRRHQNARDTFSGLGGKREMLGDVPAAIRANTCFRRGWNTGPIDERQERSAGVGRLGGRPRRYDDDR